MFAKRYDIETLLNCLEENEKNGIVYHRQGIVGDYDDFYDVEELIRFIQTGKWLIYIWVEIPQSTNQRFVLCGISLCEAENNLRTSWYFEKNNI